MAYIRIQSLRPFIYLCGASSIYNHLFFFVLFFGKYVARIIRLEVMFDFLANNKLIKENVIGYVYTSFFGYIPFYMNDNDNKLTNNID